VKQALVIAGVREVDEKVGELLSGWVEAGVFGAGVLPRLTTAEVRDSADASVSGPVLAGIGIGFSAFCVGLGLSE